MDAPAIRHQDKAWTYKQYRVYTLGIRAWLGHTQYYAVYTCNSPPLAATVHIYTPSVHSTSVQQPPTCYLGGCLPYLMGPAWSIDPNTSLCAMLFLRPLNVHYTTLYQKISHNYITKILIDLIIICTIGLIKFPIYSIALDMTCLVKNKGPPI